MSSTHLALSRALSFCCGTPTFNLDDFFHRATWELHHAAESDFAALALVMRRSDGSFFIGRSREHQTLPPETLLGLLVEEHGERLFCRVKDHALDTVRFIDNRFRTSIIVRIVVPSIVTPAADCALWFGLQSGAASESIGEAERISRDFSEWLEGYGPVIEAMKRSAVERDAALAKIAEQRSVLHDARAPLGVLKYLIRGGSRGERAEIFPVVERELEYLEKLLAQSTPVASARETRGCDVREVMMRVYDRFEREFEPGALRIEPGYDPLYSTIAALDLERVLTNLVGNALRHVRGGRTEIRAERQDERVAITVRDNGPGIQLDLLERIERGETLSGQSVSGWGIGLQSSRAKVKACGGEVVIASQPDQGTEIAIVLPICHLGSIREEQPMFVADSAPSKLSATLSEKVFIIDDDEEHAQSLRRLLKNAGVEVEVSTSVDHLLTTYVLAPRSILLCDAHMPDGGAERLLKVLSTRAEAPRLGVVSGDASDDHLYKLAALGAQAFFSKPVHFDELLAWVMELSNQEQVWRAA